jgi:protein-disulfide isomerase
MKTSSTLALFAFLGIFLQGCMSDAQLKDKMTEVLKKNPDVLTKAIEEHPVEFVDALQNAVKKAQGEIAKRREEDDKKKLEETFDKPLQPEIRADESIRGKKDAPLLLVEYSDFECPFCTRGYQTVMDLMKKYGDKIKFVYKHLPLSFHPQAMIAAKYYEAVRLQAADKAFKFHDEIFKNQGKLKNGEAFLKSVAKSVGADMDKLAKDITSKEVEARINADMEEAGKFGMQGTPGFIINGVPVKGAYPADHFGDIIGELKKRGKINL